MTDTLSLRALIRADIVQYIKFSADFSGEHYSKLRMLSSFLTPPVLCSFMHRIAHWLHQRRMGWLARRVSDLNFLIHRADITPAAEIGPGLYIPHTPGIVFYGHAGRNLTLYARAIVVSEACPADKNHQVTHAPILGDDVIVGAYAIVRGDLTVGSQSTIGPNCLLNKSIVDNTTLYHVEKINIVNPEESAN
ncbi:serine O-acetyltransferase [Methylophaga lonarensis]|uniref:serine O-acetyltransferase n=1 Tax=Methylophaga lonarensis TaxID=999151 RepID=UPI003D2BBB98